MEETDITANDENRTSINNDSQTEKFEKNSEWTQEYEVIYKSYILER